MKQFDCLQDLMKSFGFRLREEDREKGIAAGYVKSRPGEPDIVVPATDLIGKSQSDVQSMARSKEWIREDETVAPPVQEQPMIFWPGPLTLFEKAPAVLRRREEKATVRMATLTTNDSALEESVERRRRRFDRLTTRKFYSFPTLREVEEWPSLHEPERQVWGVRVGWWWELPPIRSVREGKTVDVYLTVDGASRLLVPGEDYVRFGNLIHLKGTGN